MFMLRNLRPNKKGTSRAAIARRISIAAVFALVVSPLNPFSITSTSQAVTYGTAPCVQTVGSNTNIAVVVQRDVNNAVIGCQISFTSGSNTWTAPVGVSSVKALVVGGGGGGGSHVGGGGGGGGVTENLNYSVSPGTSYSLSIGAGGAGAITTTSATPSGANRAGTGGSSTFGSITSLGGGHGASWHWQSAGTGANGGGGSSTALTGGSGSSGFAGGGGFNGYVGSNYYYATGGGAGANGNGISGSSYVSGNGGPGKLSAITGLYYGGGGGGGFHDNYYGNSIAGSGGIGGGGGGTGATSVKATSGTTNTGGGGGGSGNPHGNLASEGGNGGSGIVVLSYAINSYTITWDSNGGSTVNGTTSFLNGETIAEPTPPTRTGKYFAGWSTSETSNQGDSSNKINTWPHTPSAANLTLYAIWSDALIAYEPFSGTSGANMVSGAGTGSSGLTGNWTRVNAVKQSNTAVISNSYVSVANLALPSNTSFSLPASNTAAWVSDASWNTGMSARQLTNPISFDSSGTFYYSFINYMPSMSWGSGTGSGIGMLGFLSGLPTSSSDTAPWSLYTGATYSQYFGIDYGNANQTSWIVGQTRDSSNLYSSLSSKVSGPTTDATANFVLVKLVTSATGNDQIFLRAFSPSETLPLDDSSITWDAQYATAITGSASYLTVESEWYGALDEFRLGYTYGAVTGAAAVYTVTYEYNSATGGNSTTTANYIDGRTGLTLPTPTKTGYTFGGWYSESALTNQVGTGGATYSPSVTGTLYAKWTKNNNTVTFNANGGTGSDVNQIIQTDTSTALSSNPFTRLGYMFSSWNTNALGGGTSYTEGQSVTINGPMNLYAQWTAGTYTVTYNYNGATGNNATSSSTYTTGGTAITPPVPTKTGFTFAGWFEDSGFAGTALSATYTTTSTRTINAKWTLNVCSPVVTSVNGMTYYTFTSVTTCEWTVPAGVSVVDALVVGGGGGGGYSYNQSGAGGGAGGQVKTGQLTLGATVTVSVGQGGTGGISTARTGTAGSSSYISSITALGGGGGCGTRIACASSGVGATTLSAAFGGSGGAGGADGTGGGGSAANASGRTGGAGTVSSLSGSAITYGSGGTGGIGTSGTSSVGAAGTANRGHGGGGATAKSSSGDINGGAGGSGLIILRAAATFTVTYNTNGGSTLSAGSFQTGGSITAPSSPTKSGFTFLGWSDTDGGIAVTFPFTPASASNLTLYALWAQNIMTVSYNANGASGAPERSTDTYNRGASGLALPTVGTMTKTGYTFDGWATTIGGAKLSGAFTTTADVTLYARWVAASYAITYNSNGATSGTPSATSGSYTTGGTAITLASQSTMSRTGYTFDGWSTTVNNAASKITNSGTYTISAPVILYALWNAIDYSVTYSTQGSTSGAAPTDSTLYNISQNVVVKANTGNLAKTGFSFAGWTIASDGSGTVYQSGDTYQVASSNITLYPKWTANTYTITYNTNGASGAPSRSSDSYTTGDPGLSLPNVGTMVRTGYDFAGWSPSASGSALSGNGYTTTSNVTLYAIWTLKTINYSYAYGQAGVTNLSGAQVATFPDTTTQSGLYGSRFNLSSTVDPVISASSNSYKFMGWQYGNSIYSSGDQFTLGTSTATFTAVWVQLLEVRYALNGGTGVTSSDAECAQVGGTCSDGQSIQLNAAPTRSGYTFTGWKDQNNTSFAASATTNVTSSSFIFYAQWQAVDYTMSFNSVGGSVSNTNITKNIGDTFILPSPGTKTGYTFNGWFDGTSSYGQGATYTTGSTGVGFIALWTPNVYLVSYNWNGGVGTPTSDDSYTVGGTAISLPNGSSYVRDGYSFAGWSTTLGGATISGAFTPTQDTLLYAKWVDGSYTLTLDAHGGNLSQSSFSVARGTSLTLPIPTRTGFTFEGWFADSATTVSVAAGNAAISPTSSQTLHAKWVQNSLAGINPAHINTLASITVTGSHTWSGTHSASGTGAALSIPNGALPTGTVVNVSFIEDLSRARGIIDSTYAYYTSVAVHWLSGTGDSATVPATAVNKPLTLTLANPSILTGAKVFMIVGGVVTEVAEATQDGQVDINITQDPEFVIAATEPSLPASITASAVSGSQATVSWTAPATNGGAAITGYTVTASPGGATCTTTALTCDITGLSSGTTYSYSVVATNVVGSSSVRSTTVTYIPAPTPSAPSNIITPAPSAPSSSTVETPSGLTGIESSTMPEVATAEIAQSAPAAEEAPGVSDTGVKGGSIAEKIQKQTGLDLTILFMIMILLLLVLLVFFITWRYSLAKKR